MPSIKSVSAGLVSVTVSPSTILSNGVASSTITVRVLDTEGNPARGLAATSVVLASTGTGNTITPPTGVTNDDGEISGSIVSTVAEAKAISATVCGRAVTGTASLNVWLGEDTVAMQSTRLETGTGSALASNAFPLAPGWLMPADADKVSLFLGAVEQQIYTEPLDGLHPDGSLRAVLLQANLTVETGTPVTNLTVKVGVVRGTEDIAKTAPPDLPVLCLLPSDPTYLVSTNLLPFCAPVSMPAVPDVVTDIIARYPAAADAQWDNVGTTATRSLSLYEHIHSTFAQWIRTGEVKWWDRANRMAIAYITAYPTGTSQEWYTQSAWAPIHYWTTGRVETRTHLIDVAELASYRWGFFYHLPASGEDRIPARYIAAMLDAYKTGILASECTFTNKSDGTWAGELLYRLNTALDWQAVDGKRGGSNYCGEQKNFMAGLMMTTLIRYYEEYDADTRIVDAVQEQADWMWDDSWNADDEGFKYVSGTGSGWAIESGGSCAEGDGNGGALPPLNQLIAFAYAWLYRRTGLTLYRTRYLALLDGLYLAQADWSLTPNYALRQFDQAYCFQYVGMGLFVEAGA